MKNPTKLQKYEKSQFLCFVKIRKKDNKEGFKLDFWLYPKTRPKKDLKQGFKKANNHKKLIGMQKMMRFG